MTAHHYRCPYCSPAHFKPTPSLFLFAEHFYASHSHIENIHATYWNVVICPCGWTSRQADEPESESFNPRSHLFDANWVPATNVGRQMLMDHFSSLGSPEEIQQHLEHWITVNAIASTAT